MKSGKLVLSVMVVLMVLVLVNVGVFAEKYNEAPMLTEQVEKGELPDVSERLPENPLIVEPIEQIGSYGGTMTSRATSRFGYRAWEPLIKYLADRNEILPNVAESWNVNEDKTEFTFKLRKGIKWSDGESFTSEDIRFWYEDIVMNEAMTPAVQAALTAGGEVCDLRTPDDWTVIFKFSEPKPSFLMYAGWKNGEIPIWHYPKHYLKEFHPDYVDADQLQKKVKESGVDSWTQLMDQKVDYLTNPDIPTLTAWTLETESTRQVQTAVRNPYYWKTDPEGNQLPYIDKLEWMDIDDDDVATLKAINGELDHAMIMDTEHIPLLRNNEEKGGYRVILNDRAGLNGAGVTLYFNQNYREDEKMAELLKNKKFRQALSVAIDRNEVNEFVALGLAPERQSIMAASHPASDEELEKKYTEYDPDKAEKWLDEIGLDKRNEDGYRLLPSGEELLLILYPYGTDWRMDAGELIKQKWEDVGVKTVIKTQEPSLWRESITSGEHQVSVYANSCGMTPMLKPNFYFPRNQGNFFAPLNGTYYATDGKSGIKPEGEMQYLLELWEKIQKTIDDDERNELLREVMELHAENLWLVGIVGYAPNAIVVGDNMRNIPEKYMTALNPFTKFAEQYYFAD